MCLDRNQVWLCHSLRELVRYANTYRVYNFFFFTSLSLDIPTVVRQIDPLHDGQMDIHSSSDYCIHGKGFISSGNAMHLHS